MKALEEMYTEAGFTPAQVDWARRLDKATRMHEAAKLKMLTGEGPGTTGDYRYIRDSQASRVRYLRRRLQAELTPDRLHELRSLVDGEQLGAWLAEQYHQSDRKGGDEGARDL